MKGLAALLVCLLLALAGPAGAQTTPIPASQLPVAGFVTGNDYVLLVAGQALQRAAASSFLLGANNLSDVANAGTARLNLGLGNLSVLNAPLDQAYGGTGASSLGAEFTNSGAVFHIASGGVSNAMLANPSLTFGSTAEPLGSTVTAINGVSLGQTTPEPVAGTLISQQPSITIPATFGPSSVGYYNATTLSGNGTQAGALQLTQGWTQPLNAIRCTSSATLPEISGAPLAANCLSVDFINSGSWTGSGNVIAVNQKFNNATTLVEGNAYWTGVLSTQTINANFGGVSGSNNGIGDFYGMAVQQLAATPTSGNDYLHALAGFEIDYGEQANSFSQTKTGLTLALWNGDVGCTNVYDECAALWITSAQSGAAVNQAILVGGDNEQFPIPTTGSILTVTPPSAVTIADGIDFSNPNLTFSDAAIKGTNFKIAGSGTIRSNAFGSFSGDGIAFSDLSNGTAFNIVGPGATITGGVQINAVATGSPQIAAIGSNGNNNLALIAQGTGVINLQSTVKLSGLMQMAPVTIAGLPTCNTAAKGAVEFVSDTVANAAPTWHGAVTGGGSTAVQSLVSCTGTAWQYE